MTIDDYDMKNDYDDPMTAGAIFEIMVAPYSSDMTYKDIISKPLG